MESGQKRCALDIDECDLYRPKGFTTVALAHNEEIGRLCAIRKLDQSAKGHRMFFIEFYNTINAPHIILEWKYVDRRIAFETVSWFGKVVMVGCSDGTLLMLSPFNQETKRFPVCASPIVASVTISASQIAVASESSEVKLIEFDSEYDFIVRKTIKFGFDQRVISLAASLKLSCLAVGLVDSVVIVQIPSCQQSVIRISQNANKSTIIWCLVFKDDFLLSGDSRGKVMIHNPKTGALVKTIHSHQADVLSLVCDETDVYAAGTDYRIQRLSQVNASNKKLEWSTVQQIILHENDVRCMVKIGDYLVSGGAEHRIFVSNMNRGLRFYNVVSQASCSVTEDGRFIFTPYLDQILIWKRPTNDAQVSTFGDISVFSNESGPKLSLKLHYKDTTILQAIISPDGKHICTLTTAGIYIYNVSERENKKLRVRHSLCIQSSSTSPVTTMHASNSSLFFARGGALLERVDFETLERAVIAVRKSDTMFVKILVDASETNCLALTARSELLFADLKADGVEEDERFEKLDIREVPFDFKFHVTKEGVPLAVLIVSGDVCKLSLLNLQTKTEFKPPIILDWKNGLRGMVTGASKIVDNSIILQESRGNCCVVTDLNEVQSFVLTMHRNKSKKAKNCVDRRRRTGKLAVDTDQNDEEEIGSASEVQVDREDVERAFEEIFTYQSEEEEHADVPDQRKGHHRKAPLIEHDNPKPPFPFESHWAVNDLGVKSIVKISSLPEYPPTSIPCNLRRFNRQ